MGMDNIYYVNRLSVRRKHFSDSGKSKSNDELTASISCLVASGAIYFINNGIVTKSHENKSANQLTNATYIKHT
jgi:hypothetical protein